MNREMRRMQEREERLQKAKGSGKERASSRAASLQGKPATERKSIVDRVRTYLHEVRQEMKKVIWPTREQMIAFTAVTLVTCTILTGVVFVLDIAMKELVFFLLDRA